VCILILQNLVCRYGTAFCLHVEKNNDDNSKNDNWWKENTYGSCLFKKLSILHTYFFKPMIYFLYTN